MPGLRQRVRARLGALQEDRGLSLRFGRALDLLALLEVVMVLLDWGYLIGRSAWAQWGFRFADGAVVLCFSIYLLVSLLQAKGMRGYVRGRGGFLAGVGVWGLLLLLAWGTAGDFGGNLDASDVAQGATIHLPVFHPGALFYFGDFHALQGDGEIVGPGL